MTDHTLDDHAKTAGVECRKDAATGPMTSQVCESQCLLHWELKTLR